MNTTPHFTSSSDLITWMIATVFMAFLGFCSKKLMGLGSRADGEPKSTERKQLEEKLGPGVNDLAEPLIALMATQDARLTNLEKLNAVLLTENQKLNADMTDLEKFIAEQDAHMEDMELGTIEGRYPPFKPRPTRPVNQ